MDILFFFFSIIAGIIPSSGLEDMNTLRTELETKLREMATNPKTEKITKLINNPWFRLILCFLYLPFKNWIHQMSFEVSSNNLEPIDDRQMFQNT